jgi:hypothetical protein
VASVSIDLDAMAALVSAMNTLLATVPDHAAYVDQKLRSVYLSCPGLDRWRGNGSSLWQAEILRDDFRRRLEEARRIADSVPTFPGVARPYIVWIDDDKLAREDAAIASGMAAGYQPGENIPPDLLSLLRAHHGDPEFARQLTSWLTPAEVAALFRSLNITYQDSGGPNRPAGLSRDFRERYAELLDLIGSSLALGASTLPPDRLNAMVAAWSQTITNAPASATPLALAISRGAWPDQFLTGFQNAIDQGEQNFQNSLGGLIDPGQLCHAWVRSGAPTMIDPGRKDQDGQPVEFTDPLYGLLSAAALNPQWLLANYTGGDPVTVTYQTNGATMIAPVNARLATLLRDRGVDDQATVLALMQALSVAAGLQTLDDQPRNALDDLTDILGSIDYDQALHDALPWYQKYSHQILNIIATVTAIAGTVAFFVPGPGWLVTGLGALSTAAIGADLALNLHEGDYRAAIIDGLFLLPVAIGGTVKLIQITLADLQALKAGQMVTRFGTTFTSLEGRLIAVKFDSGLGAHLSDVARLDRNGVVGGHNLANFEQAFRDLGLDPDKAIISKTEIYPGVYNIEYQVPLRRPGGGLTDLWKKAGEPKTVYDPSVISDADMLEYATDAMRRAHPISIRLDPAEGIQYEGWSHGMKFQGWFQDGQFTSVYPVDPWS